MLRDMDTRRDGFAHSRDLVRVRRRLRPLLDAGLRRHVADLRFYQLLSEGDRGRTTRKNSESRR